MEAIVSFLLIAGVVLACPVGMWLMGRFMMKGNGGGMACGMGGHKRVKEDQKPAALQEQEQVTPPTQPATPETVAALQVKVEALERELSQLRSDRVAARAQRDGQAEELAETQQHSVKD